MKPSIYSEQSHSLDEFKNELTRSLSTLPPKCRHQKGLYQDLSIGGIDENPPEAKKICYLPTWKERIAKEFMLDRMNMNISVTDVAKACALSRSHFSRAFKEKTGLPPKEWVSKMKLRKAEMLLASTDVTLLTISLECGFSDQSHFCRAFHKHAGMTPGKWRARRLQAK